MTVDKSFGFNVLSKMVKCDDITIHVRINLRLAIEMIWGEVEINEYELTQQEESVNENLMEKMLLVILVCLYFH